MYTTFIDKENGTFLLRFIATVILVFKALTYATC